MNIFQMNILRYLAVAVFLLLLTQPCARADERLNPAVIQAFLDESSQMTHPESGHEKSDVAAYLKKHLSPRAEFITNIIYDIEGYPPQTRKIELDRTGFIKNVTDSIDRLQDYTSFAKLIRHDITGAGRKAEIVVVTSERGVMPVQGAMIPFDGKTRCSQLISWEMPHGIVVDHANCETILTIKE